MQQQVLLFLLLYKINTLPDSINSRWNWSHLYLLRISQHGICQLLYFRRHGSREKQSLSPGRNQFQYFLDIVYEAHIKHTVCLIQYKILQPLQWNTALRLQIKQTSGSGNQYLHTSFQSINLRLLGHSTENDGMLHSGISGILVKVLAYLYSKLTRRGEYQCFDTFFMVWLIKSLYKGDSKRCCFSCSCLGASQQIFTF